MNRPVPSNCRYGPELPELVLVDFLEGPTRTAALPTQICGAAVTLAIVLTLPTLTLTRPPPWPAHAGDEVANGATAMV
jgi:hypothetical protein